VAFSPVPNKNPCFLCDTMAFPEFWQAYVDLERSLSGYANVYGDPVTVVAAALRGWRAPQFLLSNITEEAISNHFTPDGSPLCKINRYRPDLALWDSRPSTLDHLCKLLLTQDCQAGRDKPELCSDALVMAFWLDYYRNRIQGSLRLRGQPKKQLTSYLRAHFMVADNVDRCHPLTN